jgi:AraC family transcriptional regulator, regulatory protein of adaptative response / methylated-DNA-[protein]-cysteine methyltransferase
MQLHTSFHACPFGSLTITTTSRGVRSLTLGEAVRDDSNDARSDEHDALCQRVLAYFARANAAQDVVAAIPIDAVGTAFQLRVWHALQQIPWGTAWSYAQLAHAIDAPRSARAVGSACGANTIAVLVPCHRVLRSDGGLGGYRWGLTRKRALLAWEAT